MARTLELDAPIGLSRYMPPQATADVAKAYQASGVIDSVSVWDQLNFFWPNWFWEQNSPLAQVMPDCDSFPDAFATLAYVAANAPGLGLCVATDAVRRSPAELLQTMLTLGDMSGKPVTLQVAAGEVKQAQPYGWDRHTALSRMEDHLRGIRALGDADRPIDFDGKKWKFDQAWIGNAKAHKPRLWGLGGGPKLLDICAEHADGFSTLAPSVASDPGRWAEIIADMRARVEKHDRDPDAFSFNLFGAAMIVHEDENVIEKALDSPIIRWISGIWGRINQDDWRREGIEPPRPGWHYALDLYPLKVTKSEIDETLARTTREIVERSWFIGTPESVAAQIQPFIDAGTNWCHLADFLPMVVEPEEGANSVDYTTRIARILKENAAA